MADRGACQGREKDPLMGTWRHRFASACGSKCALVEQGRRSCEPAPLRTCLGSARENPLVRGRRTKRDPRREAEATLHLDMQAPASALGYGIGPEGIACQWPLPSTSLRKSLRTSSGRPPVAGPRCGDVPSRAIMVGSAHEREHEATQQKDAAWVRPAGPRLPLGCALCSPADRTGLINLLEGEASFCRGGLLLHGSPDRPGHELLLDRGVEP